MAIKFLKKSYNFFTIFFIYANAAFAELSAEDQKLLNDLENAKAIFTDLENVVNSTSFENLSKSVKTDKIKAFIPNISDIADSEEYNSAIEITNDNYKDLITYYVSTLTKLKLLDSPYFYFNDFHLLYNALDKENMCTRNIFKLICSRVLNIIDSTDLIQRDLDALTTEKCFERSINCFKQLHPGQKESLKQFLDNCINTPDLDSFLKQVVNNKISILMCYDADLKKVESRMPISSLTKCICICYLLSIKSGRSLIDEVELCINQFNNSLIFSYSIKRLNKEGLATHSDLLKYIFKLEADFIKNKNVTSLQSYKEFLEKAIDSKNIMVFINDKKNKNLFDAYQTTILKTKIPEMLEYHEICELVVTFNQKAISRASKINAFPIVIPCFVPMFELKVSENYYKKIKDYRNPNIRSRNLQFQIIQHHKDKELEDIKKNLQDQITQTKNLQKALDSKKKLETQFQAEKEDLQQKNLILEEDFAKEKKLNESLQSTITQINKDLEEANNNLKNALDSKKSLEIQFEENQKAWQAKENKWNQEKQQLNNEIAERTKKLDAMLKNNTDLQDSIKQHQKYKDSLNNQLNDFQEERQRWTEKEKQLENFIENLKKALSQKRGSGGSSLITRIDHEAEEDLQEQLLQQTNKLDQKDKKIKDLEDRMQQLLNDLNTEKSKDKLKDKEQTDNSLEELEKELEEKRLSLEILQNELEEKQNHQLKVQAEQDQRAQELAKREQALKLQENKQTGIKTTLTPNKSISKIISSKISISN